MYHGVDTSIQTLFGQRNSETQSSLTFPERSNPVGLNKYERRLYWSRKTTWAPVSSKLTSNWLAVNQDRPSSKQNGCCGPKRINYGATWTATSINPLKIGFTRLPNGEYSILATCRSQDIYPSILQITQVKSGMHWNCNHASEGKKQYLVCWASTGHF